ncbi:MAG TPA: hypothetical protein VMV79_02705 [Alphaproteobacteria bacterium]|nr:hypothetical protein [Alphaproteobacteria bacterium]
MAHAPQSEAAAEPPAALVKAHRENWHVFTRSVVTTCVAVAAVLILMLLAFKVF